MNRHFDESDLWTAVYAEDVDGVKTYLNRGTNPNALNDPGNTPLFTTAARGNVEIAQELINHGANVNYINRSGETPLLLAVKFVHLPMVILLMKAGANPEMIDQYRNLPLRLAKTEEFLSLWGSPRKEEYRKIIAQLKTWPHLDPDLTDPNTGITNLMIAAVNYDADEFLKMIYYSDNINARDQDGNTALHYAVSQGYSAKKVADLINARIDFNILNKNGQRAFDFIDFGITWTMLDDRNYFQRLQERFDQKFKTDNE